MSPIRFTSRLHVGIAEIDEQHHRLAEVLNRLEDAVLAGHGREVISILAEEFERHTEHHFASEERLMDEHRYLHAEAHKEEHRTMLDDLHRHCDECVLEGADPWTMIHGFQHWFMRHLEGADRQLGEALSGAAG